MLGIQEIAEAHLVSLFNAAVQSANHAGRQTIMDKDFGLIFEIMTNSFVTQNGGASQGCKLGELKKGDKKKAEDPKMKADQHQQCPETTGAEDEEEEEDDGEYSVANSAGSAGSNESEDSLLGDDWAPLVLDFRVPSVGPRFSSTEVSDGDSFNMFFT